MEKSDFTEAPGTGVASSASSVADGTTPASVRVWLVDDNEAVRKLVAEVLSHIGGIECARHFSSPDALLSVLASQPGPDVILLDVQMGDRNGLDAVRPIKSLTRSTRVLMFTSCYNRDWRERALHDGASDYLLKSDALERVAERIRTPAQDPAPARVGRRRVSCAAEPEMANPQSSPTPKQSAHLFRRTLGRLRMFAN